MTDLTPRQIANLLSEAHTQVCNEQVALHSMWRYITDNTGDAQNVYGKAADLLNEAQHLLYVALAEAKTAERDAATAAALAGQATSYDDMCKYDTAGYGACVLPRGHLRDHRDALAHTFPTAP